MVDERGNGVSRRKDRDPDAAEVGVLVRPDRQRFIGFRDSSDLLMAEGLIHRQQIGLGAQQLAIESGARMLRMFGKLPDQKFQGLDHGLSIPRTAMGVKAYLRKTFV